MAVSISELIGKKDEIKAKKKNLYAFETSLGEFVFRVPSTEIISDAFELKSSLETNAYVIYECAVNPNLKDKELQKAYNCFEPTEIVNALFQTGEISRIADALFVLAGYTKNKLAYKLYEEIKNC